MPLVFIKATLVSVVVLQAPCWQGGRRGEAGSLSAACCPAKASGPAHALPGKHSCLVMFQEGIHTCSYSQTSSHSIDACTPQAVMGLTSHCIVVTLCGGCMQASCESQNGTGCRRILIVSSCLISLAEPHLRAALTLT